MKKTNDYLEMAIKNIKDDSIQFMSKDEQRHREVGITAAKYVETLQRSNEQLVKVASLIQKKESSSVSLSEVDKSELFDMIKGEQ